MSGTSSPPPNSTWSRWLAVLVCCVVSLTTPFDLDTVAQVLDGRLSRQLPALAIRGADDSDDEDDLVRPASAPECRRDVRKQTRPTGSFLPSRARSVCRGGLCFLPARRLAARSGGEHAFRNGCGTPLLC